MHQVPETRQVVDLAWTVAGRRPPWASISGEGWMFATASGGVRRNKLSDFVNVNRAGKIAMKLEGDDRMVGVGLCTADDDVLLHPVVPPPPQRAGRCHRGEDDRPGECRAHVEQRDDKSGEQDREHRRLTRAQLRADETRRPTDDEHRRHDNCHPSRRYTDL